MNECSASKFGEASQFKSSSQEAWEFYRAIKYPDFYYPFPEFYTQSITASVDDYKSRHVADINGRVWQIVEVDGYTTIENVPGHPSIGLMKIGSCIPIIIDWKSEDGKIMTTIMHQGGGRSVQEISQNYFESLDIFLEQIRQLKKIILRCRMLQTKKVSLSSPEDLHTNLREALLARLLDQDANIGVKVIYIPDSWIPYDLQYVDEEISVIPWSDHLLRSLK